jgi:hypothetical protein
MFQMFRSRTGLVLLLVATVAMVDRVRQPEPFLPVRALSQPPGRMVAESPPVQKAIKAGSSISFSGAQLTPMADFSFDARLLSTKWYRFDASARFSPVDLGIAWGKMSDSANIDALTWGHGGRFLTYRYQNAPPIPQAEIMQQVANIHVLPANPNVLRQIAKLRPGQRIVGKGKLVNLNHPDGFTWNSSLTRDDDGGGACELLYLTDVRAGN